MQLPADVYTVVKAFAEAFPIPQGTPGPAHEDQCRYWTKKLAAQVVFSFPGQGYGLKKASATRPQGKDSIARLEVNGHLHSWDILIGSGTGAPRLATKPAYADLGQNGSPQYFIPVVGADWLGAAGTPLPVPQPPSEPPTEPPTGTPAPGSDLEAILRLEAKVDALAAVLSEIGDSLPALDDAVVTRLDALAAVLQKGQIVEFKVFGAPVKGRIYPA